LNTTQTAKGAKGYKGLGMEGALARWYARNTASRDHRKTAELVAAQSADGATVLEVAPGPGFMAIELARLGDYRVTGLDISKTFVEIATANARAAGVVVDFRHGNASDMPFPADSFDFIVCQAAFKNFSEPVRALCEMHRVLKPGGKGLILDLRPDASAAAVNAEVEKMGLSWFNALMTKLTFKYCLLKRAYSQGEFQQMADQTPFRTCEIQEDPLGLAVSFAK
jgi:ubiquinone/menaquinone biosynthesis C-methylase UbiE